MGCCISKPCLPKCCEVCCKRKVNIKRDDDLPNCTELGTGGDVSIEMDELAEEDEEEEVINDEATSGAMHMEVSTSRQQSSRGNHNNNSNNDDNVDRRTNNKARVVTHGNGPIHATPPLSRESTSSQHQFFKMLDEKIESGLDYDVNCERERKRESERLNTLMRGWETASRNSSQPGTPIKRPTSPTALKPGYAASKSAITSSAHASHAQPLQQHQLVLQGHGGIRGIPPPHQGRSLQQQQPPAVVTGIQAGRYWPPLEPSINDYDELYEYEVPIQKQRVTPIVNHTATIIHQTYGVIGFNVPIPALLRTGLGGGNVPSPAMTNQLFQFGPRNGVGGTVAGPSSAREYHQEMYTGATTVIVPAKQQFAIYDQNGMPSQARSALIPISQQQQQQLNPNLKYDLYTYRPTPGSTSSGSIAPSLPSINASAQLKFSTLVSQGTPLQFPIQFYGNGEVNKPLNKKVPQSPDMRPSKKQMKHHQVIYGEVHQPSKPTQVAQKVQQQNELHMQENQQKIHINSPYSASGSIPGHISDSSVTGSTNARSFQSSVHIPMKATVPELQKAQYKGRKEHSDKKKIN